MRNFWNKKEFVENFNLVKDFLQANGKQYLGIDWRLDFVPNKLTFCFLNSKTQKRFHLVCIKGKVVPHYLKSTNKDDIFFDDEPAESIEEAIQKNIENKIERW